MSDALNWLLTTPAIAQVLLAFLLLELVLIGAWRARRGGGVPFVGLICFLGAGAGFSVALWAALAAWPWPWMAAALSAAFAFHAADLYRRWEK